MVFNATFNNISVISWQSVLYFNSVNFFSIKDWVLYFFFIIVKHFQHIQQTPLIRYLPPKTTPLIRPDFR
jgi:hypothetical protein